VEDLVANVSGQIMTEMQDLISEDTNNNKELTYTQGLKIAWILAHAEHSEDNKDPDIDISFSDFAQNPGAIFGRSYEDIKDRYEVPYMHTMNCSILHVILNSYVNLEHIARLYDSIIGDKVVPSKHLPPKGPTLHLNNPPKAPPKCTNMFIWYRSR